MAPEAPSCTPRQLAGNDAAPSCAAAGAMGEEKGFASHHLLEGEEPSSCPIVSLLARALEQLVMRGVEAEGGAPQARTPSVRTCFDARAVPSIGLVEYCVRIAKYARVSPSCFALAACFMERLAERDADYMPTRRNVHKLLLVGVMLAAKLSDDRHFNNAFYARVGGIPLCELNRLELGMLTLLDYRLHVEPGCVRLRLDALAEFGGSGRLGGRLAALLGGGGAAAALRPARAPLCESAARVVEAEPACAAQRGGAPALHVEPLTVV